MDLFDLIVGFLAGVGLLALVAIAVAGVMEWREGREDDEEEDDDDESLSELDDDDRDGVAVAEAHAEALEEERNWWDMTPEALEREPRFEAAVEALCDEGTAVSDVIDLSRHPDGWAASMALVALQRRDDVPEDWAERAIRALPRSSNCEDCFQLRAIARHTPVPAIGLVLARREGIHAAYVVEFVQARLEAGEEPDIETFRGVGLTTGDADELAAFLDRHGAELDESVRAAFDEWRIVDLLGSIGRVWQRPYDRPPALLVGRRKEAVDLILAALTNAPRRSVLLVGDHGAGKTALARAALDRAPDLTVFEATASQVNAGQMYIGELEGRVKRLVDGTRGRNTIWVLPELQEALFAGQHSRSPQGLLDFLLPHVESGAITIVAEATPAAFDVVRAQRPRVASAFDVIRVRTLEHDDSIEVARHMLEHIGLGVTADDATLVRAQDLAQQFLPGIGAPGGLLRLVGTTASDAHERGGQSFDASDVLQTLASASGLPLALLDAAAPLRLDDVRAFFERRILQQPDAVDCVVERIAMIKAGLTDPTRPLGVFLFLGPTGTGKTEIAKALAEFLFGSPERLVRLDMSEFQTPQALDRLLSEANADNRGAALVSAVRRDPFSVVLLDEFEKAAEPIWDVFLQVFDDGRLTDTHGQVVDFRRCVIVLTSNVGSSIAAGGGVGFEPTAAGFSETLAQRALSKTFRPEFLNRLDRVVMFRPFERSAMRSLLDKELADALARRGLRERPWAVEIDESASSFLIEKGFSPTLGARPLRRAIEQHVLAPLAAAIVEQTVPEGDQFLFLSAPGGTRVEVAFVDPDADDVVPEEEPDRPLEVRELARRGRVDERTARFLVAEARRVGDAVAALAPQKDGALAALNEPAFWETPGRFDVLAKAEYIDRLEAATETATALAGRVERSMSNGGRASADLVALLAGRLHVLTSAIEGLAAGEPYELFLEVASQEANPRFAFTVAGMYEAWADARGMRLERLPSGATGRHLFAVEGLGCWRILEPEAGLHVLELTGQDGERVTERETVRVTLAARDTTPAPDGTPLFEVARAALAKAPSPNTVVRRYRTGPAPLVRDSARGYRTGHLEQVLAGGFDLY